MFSVIIDNALNQVYESLSIFAKSQEFSLQLALAFGSEYNKTLALSLQSQWLNQDFSYLPSIEVIGGDILGPALGGYASSTNTIYLSALFVAQASQHDLVAVLLEEIGHFLDARLNLMDSLGDEGNIFANLVQGTELTPEKLEQLKLEDDSANITLNGQEISIEQAIYGDDNRFAVGDTPWDQQIAWINATFSGGQSGSFTGALISPFHILTVGHGVYGPDSGFATSINVSLGFGQEGTKRPYGIANVVRFNTYADFTNTSNWTQITYQDPSGQTVTEWTGIDKAHDFAILTLDRNIGNFTGWFGYQSNDNVATVGGLGFYTNETVFTAGYPGDLDANNDGLPELYTTSGELGAIFADSGGIIEHRLDSAKGQSGSPIWIETDGIRRIIGVHAGGQVGVATDGFNEAARITDSEFDEISNIINQSPPPTDKPDLADHDDWWFFNSSFFRNNTTGDFINDSSKKFLNVSLGESITFQSRIRNNGTARFDANILVSFYASHDTTIDSNDSLIGQVNISGIDPFNQSWATLNTNFNNVPSGSYVVGYKFSGFFSEYDTGNNTGIINGSGINVNYADLAGSLFDVKPEPIKVGNSFSVDFKISNFGFGNSYNSTVNFYLSSTKPNGSIVSFGDHLLGSFTVGNIPSLSTTATLTKTLFLPNHTNSFWTNLNDSNYFIYMAIDPLNAVKETNESNNQGRDLLLDYDEVLITTPKDLSGTFFATSSSVLRPGSSPTIQFRIDNSEFGTVSNSKFSFYISKDQVFGNATDLLLASSFISSLSGNSTTDILTVSLSLPSISNSFWADGDGTYYIGMVLDSDNKITETNETNNQGTGVSLDYDDILVIGATPIISVSATDAIAAETSSGQPMNPGVFTLFRTGYIGNSLSVRYILSGSATNGVDYTGLVQTATFDPGEFTTSITIQPLDDNLFENTESIDLELVTNPGVNYILDQDLKKSTITIAANAFNTIIGNANDNSLNGGTAFDWLVGGAGNDTYVVNSTGDVVVENSSQGTDAVYSSVTYSLSANVENLILTGSSAINGTGNALNNTITGNGASNSLNGWIGADRLVGGLGNDHYVRDNSGDVISETSTITTEIDTVYSSISYSLTTNLENLILIGASNINGTGNGLANTVTGNSGNNSLNGSMGADRLIGGLGNDNYVRDNTVDVIVENSSQGTDTVFSNVTYSLVSNVENLILIGSSAINGTGNSLNNTITGNSGANSLNGGTGADRLIGGLGNDNYVRDNTVDVIVENSSQGTDTVFSNVTYSLVSNVENLILTGSSAINGTGNTLNNTITGNSAANSLNGGAGIDVLTGGGGNDTLLGGVGADRLIGGSGNDFYRFNARTEGIDTIVDFSKVSSNTDKIQVLASGFGGGLPFGTLSNTRFVLGTAATNTSHRFIYNQSNGALFFDVDGLGGTAQVQLATLSTKPGLVASDIVVV